MTAPETATGGSRRIAIIAVVFVALAGGVIAGRADTSPAQRAPAPVDGAQRPNPGALSTAWYCPGLPAAFPVGEQTVTLSNLGASDADVVVTVQPDGGAAPIVKSVTVPHESVRTFSRASFAKAPGPVVVEPFSPDVVVEAGIESDAALDSMPCANTAGTDWYFAAGTTVRGVSQWLVLDDPFSTDARVDVSLRTDGGLQLLPALQGIDVPGRSRVVIPIHDQAVRQARVAVEVHAGVGKVVASQTLQFGRVSGPVGITSALGAIAPSSQWWFTDGDTRTGATQSVALADVGPADAHVAVQALIGTGGIVQPVVITVASGAVVWVQVGGCARNGSNCLDVPAKTRYELLVQVDSHVPIVAQTLSRFGNDNGVLGAATSMGSTAPARQWVIPRTRAAGRRSTSISLMNAGVRAAHVAVEVVHDGVVDRPAELQQFTIAANSRAVLPADIAGPESRSDAAAVIVSDAPILAEATIYGKGDATRVQGIPTR